MALGNAIRVEFKISEHVLDVYLRMWVLPEGSQCAVMLPNMSKHYPRSCGSRSLSLKKSISPPREEMVSEGDATVQVFVVLVFCASGEK